MLRLFFDHDFNHRILRALVKRIPDLDYVTTQQLKIGEEEDSSNLQRAAEENRIIISHDVNTMTEFAKQRIRQGEKMSGLIIVPQTMPIGQAIDELEMIILCSFEDEFENFIRYLPFGLL